MSAVISRKAKYSWLTVVAVAAFILSVAGCSSTSQQAGGAKSLSIEVSQRGSIMFDGYPVRHSRLIKTLKRAGATSRTAIKVNIPKEASSSTVKKITETLVAGGLPRVVFSTPRIASAEKAQRR